jgi:hypothetical protein
MALNPYFIQGTSGEQSLVQDLINEQLKMYGVECYYLPRQYATTDNVIKEVISSDFNYSYPIEAYVENFDGYGDNVVMLSKFGIQAENELTVTISKERFENYISPLIKNLPNVELSTRPKEGDLIYFPLGDRLFEIKFVEHEKPFYQLKKNYVYTLTCQLFRPEDEILDTGIEEIDDTFDTDFNLRTLTVVAAGTTALASAGIVTTGGVNQIIITDRGERYLSAPTVAISSSPRIGGQAVGISTLLSGITNCDGTDIGEKVQGIYITNPGIGYTNNPGIVILPVDGDDGVGAAATTRISDNVVGVVTLTSGGSGYTTAPSVTISGPGIGTTASAIAVVSSAGTISNVYVTYAGAGYTVAPTITIGDPYMAGTGTYEDNETITGSSSGVTAIVKTWNAVSGEIVISNSTGDFVEGENITGDDSGAVYQLRIEQDDNTVDAYPSNLEIEDAADDILDFTEKNPFGTP